MSSAEDAGGRALRSARRTPERASHALKFTAFTSPRARRASPRRAGPRALALRPALPQPPPGPVPGRPAPPPRRSALVPRR